MIANSEINETGKIFFFPFLVCPAGFFKESVTPIPYNIFGNFIVPSEKGQADRKLCQFVIMHCYMQYEYILSLPRILC